MLKNIIRIAMLPLKWVGRYIPTRLRIVSSLVAMVVVSIVFSMSVQVFPNPHAKVLQGRASITESLAMSATTLITSGNRNGLRALLEGLAKRQDEVLSIGLRKPDGSLHVAAGPHEATWDASLLKFENGQVVSTDSQMSLPVYQRSDRWADLEIAFAPYEPPFGVDPWIAVIIVVVPSAFLQFYLFLGFVMKQLDASGAVPTHVREVLDNLGLGLLLLDMDDRILLANPVIVNDLRSTQRKLIGLDASEMPWINSDHEQLPWTETLARGVALSNRLLEMDVEGKRCMFSVNSTPIAAGDGNYQGVMVTFKDITVLEENKRELAVARDAAENANHAKSQFLANISHEIRTPMNSIVGFTDVLRRGLEEDAERQIEYLDTIYTNGNHLVSLINDVLDLSKIESAGVELEIRDCSPYRLVSEVVTVLTGKANDQGIELSANANGRIPATIKTDPTRLRQILINLVGNAVKFTKQGGVRIDYGVSEGPAGPQIRFDVIDTGIGMTQEQASKIFNPFVQADSSVTRRFGGTGLGLSISKKFAEAMGGGISVTSEPGKGSVFTVMIDAGALDGVRMLSAEEASAAVKQERASTTQGIATVRAGKILIVDDTPANIQLLRVVCTKAGLDVDSAENGEIAIRMATQTDYDVILMDMQMPIVDGYTATSELRKLGLDTPIVALTGNAMEEDRRRCFDAGCSEFLTKPVNIDALIALLQKLHGVGEQTQTDAAPRKAIGLTTTVAFEPKSEGKVASTSKAPIQSQLPMDVPEFQTVVQQFVDGLASCVSDIHDSFKTGDYETLARQAHALKGSGGTVGFPQFTEPAQALEAAAKSGQAEEIESLLVEIADIASRAVGPGATGVQSQQSV